MKNLLRLILVLLPMLVMSGQGQALAESLGGKVEVSPFIGYYWFDHDINFKDHVVWGGRLGYLYNDNLEAEVTVAAVRTKIDASSRSYTDLRQLQADALYNFTGFGKLVPYVAAGIGVVHFDPAADGDREASFLLDYGVGARYFITDNLAARLDLRQPIIFNGSESNYMATVGISYYFGGAKPVEKAAEVAPVSEPAVVPEIAPKAPEVSPAVKTEAAPSSNVATAPANVAAGPAEPLETKAAVQEAPAVSAGGLVPVYFDFDKSLIRQDQVTRIAGNALYLKSNPEDKVRIEGNCDERGTNEYNLALGERRATSAKKYLVNLGIAESRISTLSYGEERPLNPGHDEAAWAENRRDDFVITQ